MTLNVSDCNYFMREVRSALENTENHHHWIEDMYRKLHGQGYKRQSGLHEYHLEPHYFDWVSLVLPKLVYSNPKVKVGTRLHHAQSADAEAMHYGLNRWILDNDPRKFLVEGPVLDMQFTYGVGMVAQKPIPRARPVEGIGPEGEPGKPYSPVWYHVPATYYFSDPLATRPDEKRFEGHKMVRDHEDLIAMAKADPDDWNLKAIEALSPDMGIDELMRDRRVDAPRREEVVYYEVWVPEYELEEGNEWGVDASPGKEKGFHGTIFTLPGDYASEDTRVDYLRKPRPFFGHWSGPYCVFGAYPVPLDPTPLGPLAAVSAQVEEWNRHAYAVSRSMADYKQMAILFNCDNELTQIIKDGEHQFVFDGKMSDNGQIAQVEVAGATPQMLEHLAILGERVQRVSGLNDAQRGLVSGRGTATENAIADAASDIRIGWLKQQIDSAVIGMFKKTAFYMYMDKKVVFPLGPEIAAQMGAPEIAYTDENGKPKTDALGRQLFGPPEAMFRGGMTNKDASFEDLELEIEPYSMERTSQATLERNANILLQMATTVFPLIPQIPGVKWRDVLDRIGDALNIPDLGELVDPDAAQEAMAQQMTGQTGVGEGSNRPQLVPQPPGQRFVSGGGPRGGNASSSRGSGSGPMVRTMARGGGSAGRNGQ